MAFCYRISRIKRRTKKNDRFFESITFQIVNVKIFVFVLLLFQEHFQEMKKPCKEKGDFLFTYIISQWKQQQQKQKQKTEKSIHEIGRVCV